MQPMNNQKLHFFVSDSLLTKLRKWCVEPFFKRLTVIEDIRKTEIQQSPQFVQIILHTKIGMEHFHIKKSVKKEKILGRKNASKV